MDTMADLSYPRGYGIEHKKIQVLTGQLFVEQWVVPKGTEIVIFQTRNFGWVIIPDGTKDIRGFIIPKHIFNY